jgi:hypothetical protein
MKFPFFNRKAARRELSIAEALEDRRADLAVAGWLQKRVLSGEGEPPAEVTAAYRVDKFLQEVNMGGLSAFFESDPEEVVPTVQALRAVGLEDVAQLVENARIGAASDEIDEHIIESSRRIESTTHEYIRSHLSVFQTLD